MRDIASLFRRLLRLPEPAPAPVIFTPSDDTWRSLPIADALRAWKLDRYADGIADAAKWAIALRPTRAEQASLGIGSSRLGGMPDLPPQHGWPTWRGRSMGFLAQINLQDLAATAPNNPLPSKGMLCFWYDLNVMPWESDENGNGGFLVEYIADASALTTHSLPRDYYWRDGVPLGTQTFAACSLTFCLVHSVPDVMDQFDGQSCVDAADFDQYRSFVDAFRHQSPQQSGHQLLGYPWLIQGSMHEEVAIAAWRQQPENADAPAYLPQQIRTELGSQWRLLAQFNTDEATGFEWGDTGMLYFWIRHDDLEMRRFDRVRSVMECY